MKVRICNIQHFCTHDGAGIRTTVFLAGCPLRCLWCHNPEGQSLIPRLRFYPTRCIGCGECKKTDCGAQIFAPGRTVDRSRCISCLSCVPLCPAEALEAGSRETDTETVLAEVRKDIPFYGKDGGITLSGGEPTVQSEAALALLRGARDAGITTALETCGYFPADLLPALVPLTDTFLFDIKDTDPARHLQNTGVPLQPILDNLRNADRLGAVIRLRCILIRGINDTKEHFAAIAALAASLRHCTGVDVIPYHPMGMSKYESLGMTDTFDGREHIPTDEQLAAFRAAVSLS